MPEDIPRSRTRKTQTARWQVALSRHWSPCAHTGALASPCLLPVLRGPALGLRHVLKLSHCWALLPEAQLIMSTCLLASLGADRFPFLSSFCCLTCLDSSNSLLVGVSPPFHLPSSSQQTLSIPSWLKLPATQHPKA